MQKLFIITITSLLSVVLFSQTPYKSLNYLYSISGKYTIAGQHNKEPNGQPRMWTDSVYAATGKYPALWSGDFLFGSEPIENRWKMIYEAKNQWDNGAIINIMWHACPPVYGEPCRWRDSCGVLSHLSDAQWADLVTNGGKLNTEWKKRMDNIAQYLHYLKENGVEVLFRPFHEMNQGAFWWGGRKSPNGTAKLYRLTHNYLVKEKGLTNLIWVWNIQDFPNFGDDIDAYNPGNEYWDILSLDVYEKAGYTEYNYNTIVKTAGGKPVAIGECAHMPNAEILAKQPLWTFFMPWAELTFKSNTRSEIIDIYNAPMVISLCKMPGW